MTNERVPKEYPRYIPRVAIPPGDTVQETIEYLGLTQADLADRMGRPKKLVNEIIKGKAAITPETALQLERVLGVPAGFWSTLERNYRDALARGEEAERLVNESQLLELVPVKDMIRAGWVPKVKDQVGQVQAVLDFFGVASLAAFQNVFAKPQVAYRKSLALESDPGALAAWLRQGEILAQRIECEPYNAEKFKRVLQDIRALTTRLPEEFCPQVERLAAGCGVAVAFVPELPRCRVSGAARWLTPEKALIQLSARHKSDDHLWFSFFHEACHVLNHNKKTVFLDDHPSEAGAEEKEANDFAEEALIPWTKFKRFLARGAFTESAIRKFADEVGISPGIVLGRLQFEHRVPFPTKLNTLLKQHYTWSD